MPAVAARVRYPACCGPWADWRARPGHHCWTHAWSTTCSRSWWCRCVWGEGSSLLDPRLVDYLLKELVVQGGGLGGGGLGVVVGSKVMQAYLLRAWVDGGGFSVGN